MKIVNFEEKNLLNALRNFNEIFKKHVTYDTNKRHKKAMVKAGLHPLFRKQNFGRTTGQFRNCFYRNTKKYR